MSNVNENFHGIIPFDMIEKEAKKKLCILEKNCQVYQSPNCKESQTALSKYYEAMNKQLHSDEERNMLLEFDSLVCEWASTYGEDMFVHGFCEGMKYFRDILERGLESKKERTAATAIPVFKKEA